MYRATETETATRCPALWLMKRKGWRPASYDTVDVAAAIGRAIHAGAAVVHNDLKDGRPTDPDVAIDTGAAVLYADLDTLSTLPARSANAVEYLSSAWKRYAAAMKTFIDVNPLRTFVVNDVERKLPHFGNSTIDVGVIDPDGKQAIVDIKTRRFSSEFYRQRYIDEFATSWQMRHYLAGYAYETQRFTYTLYLLLIDMRTVTPKIELHRYNVSDEQLSSWIDDALEIWQRMKTYEANGYAPKVADHYTRYGRCEFYRKCFHPDESRLEYVKEG